MIYKLYIFSVF